jgi:tRNA1Val (adenine37-N6)-methyltransferase
MEGSNFNFKQFDINQERAVFKVGTDGVLLGACADTSGAKRILDIGSGTGLIAIMLAQKSEVEIVAIEPDHDSYLEAVQNVRNCRWSGRIKVVQTDLQSYDPSDTRFDLIVTNPPYFNESLRSPDPRKSAARHNDTLTSDELLKGVSRLLEETGRFQLIMPYVEGNVLIAEAQQYGFYCNSILKIKPLPTSEIRRLILTFSRQQLKHSERFLTIEQGRRHEFTEEYINLTKDFYLKF